ncbi:MAG: glutamate racemase [Candidatus Paceibacterota bacterium]
MKIGFFDSGLGGLLILKSVVKELPNFDYEYYGDTANLPYGDRSEEEIFAFTKKGVEALFNKDCGLVIIACNTASAETLRKLQDTVLVGQYAERRILGVIIPTVEVVAETGQKSVALLATSRTVNSKKYDLELMKVGSNLQLKSHVISALVPLIEAGKEVEAFDLTKDFLEEIIQNNINVMVLGCTHYCLLKQPIRDYVGERVRVISQDEIIPSKLQNYLERHPEIKNALSNTGLRNIFLTKASANYDEIISNLLGGVLMAK